jgi:hypothetical protein
VKIDGDTATSVALPFHSHEARAGVRSLIDAGYWYDTWVRTSEGWRIKERSHKACYTNTYPVVTGPPFLDV